MRTTVTLEKDLERMLRDAMHRSLKSFKQTLNAALRTGLSGKTVKVKARRFVVEAGAGHALRASDVSHKWVELCGAQNGLGQDAKEGVYPQRYSTD